MTQLKSSQQLRPAAPGTCSRRIRSESHDRFLDPERFRGPDDPFPGHWRAYPGNWQRLPEETLAERETLDVVLATIHQLPPPQRLVIAMRDIQGCDAAEVCEALDVSEGNQRVLLHRARNKVRRALESRFDG